MPIDPGTAKQLADAGGWAVAIFETALIAVLVLRGAAKRWYVMGWLYDRTEARADTADLQVERTITAITAMTAAMAAQTTALVAHTTEHAKLVKAMEGLRDELRRGRRDGPA